MNTVIIEYGGANIASIKYALERLGETVTISDDVTVIQRADYVILPGVGNADCAMENLRHKNLINVIRNLQQPVLGICLGMQILFETSQEVNDTPAEICTKNSTASEMITSDTITPNTVECLGIMAGNVQKIPNKIGFRIPHMGWNMLQITQVSPLLQGIENTAHFYFVHSFYVGKSPNTIATTHHADSISAIVQKDNFYGCQFHPEKSGEVGQAILKNFLNL